MKRNRIIPFIMATVLFVSLSSLYGGLASPVEADSAPPPSSPTFKYPEEIVVKFKPHVDIPYQDQVEAEVKALQDPSLQAALTQLPQVNFSRLFSILDNTSQTHFSAQGNLSVFEQYYTVSIPTGANMDMLLQQFKNSPLVEEAYIKPQPVSVPSITLAPNSTPVQPDDDPNYPLQGYAAPAPLGIYAPYAWQYEGGDGKGIKWVDVEQGWAFNHEDLASHAIPLLPGGINALYFSHGTAVLGQVSAVDNTIGNIGLASKAQPFASSQHRTNYTYNTAEAIIVAANTLSAGDVILLEAQTGYPTASGYVPVEVYPAEFDAIRYAVDRGITVVEAAGNGSVDLDRFQTVDGKYILNPNHPDFRDSGAVIVGAASASLPHKRMGFSTHGNRIDAYAWGSWDVHTLDAIDANSTTGYMKDFAGTSAASPIVTASAISMQGIAKATFGVPYSPAELRRLIKSAAYNTPTADPARDKIGFMPNLREMIKNLKAPGSVPHDTVAPLAPTGLVAVATAQDSVSFTWNAATDDVTLIGYDLYVNGNLLPSVWTSDTSATLYSLTPGTTYTITVKARDGSNNLSEASAPLSVTTVKSSICSNNEWNASSTYLNGHQASYNGVLYQAKWWSQNQRPDQNSGPHGVWSVVQSCATAN
ncbi:S8 family serine peptidase [Paenibacillus taiwanensis]|uniref:S8 family serine peptidase n=1 Tax=Paenibacillus taiwanensis TaxID=401638 RepID=UPI000416D745|nr:S8 family serine peptidase [Paenibacillus taiwanensis]